MAKKTSGGKRTENPPPKTTQPVKHVASKSLSSKSSVGFVKKLAASVMRHIEPRKGPKGR